MKQLTGSLFLLFLVACSNNESATSTTRDTTIVTTTPTDGADRKTPDTLRSPKEPDAVTAGDCYWMILKRDTFVLHLKQSGTAVTGKASFDNYEKDASSGPVHGQMKGNVLKLWYNFASEGMNSVMELYFQKTAAGLIRGTGEMQTKGDTAYFSQPEAVQYSNDQLFRSVSCSQVPAKYKNE